MHKQSQFNHSETYLSYLLQQYFSKQASVLEQEQLWQWVTESAANKARFVQEKKLWDASLLIQPNYPQEAQWQQLHARIQKHKSRKRYLRWSVAAVLAFLLSLPMMLPQQHEKENTPAELAYQNFTTKSGEQKKLLLEDGTVVWINAETQLRYPNQFDSKRREVYLDGEAYFEVFKTAERPFIIHTAKLDVQVLGTKFNLSAYAEDPTVETSLYSGLVALSSEADNLPVAKLHPNQKAVYHKISKALSIQNVDIQNDSQWIHNRLVFRDMSFNRIVKKLKRKFGIDVQLQDSSLNHIQFTGEFDSESLQDILENFKHFLPIRYDFAQDGSVKIYKI